VALTRVNAGAGVPTLGKACPGLVVRPRNRKKCADFASGDAKGRSQGVDINPFGPITKFVSSLVDSDQRVQVNRTPSLELDDLHIGQPEAAGCLPCAHPEQRPQ
jgi:hypothetical protein